MADKRLTDSLRDALRLPRFGRGREAITPPRKALILQPCCLRQVMQTTPLLYALHKAFPEARFDWAVSDQSRMGINGNQRLTRVISTGAGMLQSEDLRQIAALADRLKQEQYDTCFLPNDSTLAAMVARQAGIPQRVGLDTAMRYAAPGEMRQAAVYLGLAAAANIDPAILDAAEMEFFPADSDRTFITRWLVEEFDWLGDVPLVILHPGGEDGVREPKGESRLWPAERYARLANHLGKIHGARIVLAGTAADRALAAEVAGMMSFPAVNQAGRMSLGQLGALAELAGLYVGNDVGPSYVVAATRCPTVVIYGPTDPAVTVPFMRTSPVRALRTAQAAERAFTPAAWVSVEEATAAVDALMTGAE